VLQGHDRALLEYAVRFRANERDSFKSEGDHGRSTGKRPIMPYSRRETKDKDEGRGEGIVEQGNQPWWCKES
jgi:hypothetical protein